MLVTLLGVRVLDFPASDGSQIKGTQLFYCHDDPDVQGKATDKVFVKSEIPMPKLELNKPLQIYFNKKGKVDSIAKAD